MGSAGGMSAHAVGIVVFWYCVTLVFNWTAFNLVVLKDDPALALLPADITLIEMFACTICGALTLYSKGLAFIPPPELRVRMLVLALANAAALFVMLIFVFACLIYMVESLGEVPWFDYYYNSRATYDTLPMTLSEAAYFTMISISTVGYGDYSPSTVIGRVLTMFFILGGIMFFTTVTHDSVEMVRYLRSGYGRYKRLSGVPHTVIVGDMSADTLGHLFQEFFTESRRN